MFETWLLSLKWITLITSPVRTTAILQADSAAIDVVNSTLFGKSMALNDIFDA